MKSICTLPDEGGSFIRVEFAEGGQVFRGGDIVELDAEATPDQTWREALGTFADAHFAEIGDAEAFEGAAGPAQE